MGIQETTGRPAAIWAQAAVASHPAVQEQAAAVSRPAAVGQAAVQERVVSSQRAAVRERAAAVSSLQAVPAAAPETAERMIRKGTGRLCRMAAVLLWNNAVMK